MEKIDVNSPSHPVRIGYLGSRATKQSQEERFLDVLVIMVI
jgi:hypothetical protein